MVLHRRLILEEQYPSCKPRHVTKCMACKKRTAEYEVSGCMTPTVLMCSECFKVIGHRPDIFSYYSRPMRNVFSIMRGTI